MEETYYVIRDSLNWADEMDIDSVSLYTGSQLKAAKADIKKIKKEYPNVDSCYISLGTNEEEAVTIDEVEDYLKSARKISKSEYNVIKRYVGQVGVDLYESFMNSVDYKIEREKEHIAVRKEEVKKQKAERAKYKASALGKHELLVKNFIEDITKDIENEQ